MNTYHPLGKQQWENTNDVQLKLFAHNPLFQSIATENRLLWYKNTQRLFDGRIPILFMCKLKQT